MAGKLLFLDLDGTLLNDQKEVTPEDRAALQKALAAGHRVVIASGRPLESVRQQARKLQLDGPGCFLIAYNGAVIYDCTAGREVFRKTLSFPVLARLFDEAARREIYIQTYDAERVVVERGADTANTLRYCAATGMEWQMVENVEESLSAPPVKTLMIDYTGREKTEPMRRWVCENLSEEAACYFSSAAFLETVPANIDKGRAVADLCNIVGADIADTVAVGDEANDLAMLRAAHVGAAMANGVEAVKAAADYVTEQDNNHGGVAEVIAKYLLSGA